MRTDLDIKREEKAEKVNKKLIGTKLKVIAGGKKTGPYSIVIERLNEKEMRRLVPILLSLQNNARY